MVLGCFLNSIRNTELVRFPLTLGLDQQRRRRRDRLLRWPRTQTNATSKLNLEQNATITVIPTHDEGWVWGGRAHSPFGICIYSRKDLQGPMFATNSNASEVAFNFILSDCCDRLKIHEWMNRAEQVSSVSRITFDVNHFMEPPPLSSSYSLLGRWNLGESPGFLLRIFTETTLSFSEFPPPKGASGRTGWVG